MATAFAAARKAAERARRAAKKAKAVDSATSAASTDGTAAVASVVSAVAIVWEPVQLFDQPRTSEETDGAAGVREPGSLPGKLHEHVQVTPNGRRSHHIKHTSPGGTMREQHYASPAGVPQLHHENDDGWPAWRLSIAADLRKVRSERETAEKADKDARCPWRYVQYGRCTSRGFRRQPGCRGCTRKGVQAGLVCEFALTQLNYTEYTQNWSVASYMVTKWNGRAIVERSGAERRPVSRCVRTVQLHHTIRSYSVNQRCAHKKQKAGGPPVRWLIIIQNYIITCAGNILLGQGYILHLMM